MAGEELQELKVTFDSGEFHSGSENNRDARV